VQPSLQSALRQVASKKIASWTGIDCKGAGAGAPKLAAGCTLGTKPVNPGINAKWVAAPLAGAAPIRTVGDPKCSAVLVSLAGGGGGFVLVEANDRPVSERGWGAGGRGRGCCRRGDAWCRCALRGPAKGHAAVRAAARPPTRACRRCALQADCLLSCPKSQGAGPGQSPTGDCEYKCTSGFGVPCSK
jgi:hypothetical protein